MGGTNARTTCWQIQPDGGREEKLVPLALALLIAYDTFPTAPLQSIAAIASLILLRRIALLRLAGVVKEKGEPLGPRHGSSSGSSTQEAHIAEG